MKIGVLSDTHDRTGLIQAALDTLRHREAAVILHCGDVQSPDTVALFKGVPTHFVFGNWDGDAIEGHRSRASTERDFSRMRAAIGAIGGTVHEPFGHLELAGRYVAWIHGDDRQLLRELVEMDYFDFVCYGHTHRAEQHRMGRTLLVNPGALFKVPSETCAVIDLGSDRVEWIPVRETAATRGSRP